MFSRRFLVLGGVWFLFNVQGRAYGQEAWTSYRNARYGTSIAYQEFFEPDAPPANGDGRSFTGPEGANFVVFARLNEDNETPATYLAKMLASPSHSNVRYTHIGNNRLTISGIRGELIYYDAYIFSRRGIIHAFEMEYPARFKSSYDPTVQRMSRSFMGP
jgi:hypothetical protein